MATSGVRASNDAVSIMKIPGRATSAKPASTADVTSGFASATSTPSACMGFCRNGHRYDIQQQLSHLAKQTFQSIKHMVLSYFVLRHTNFVVYLHSIQPKRISQSDCMDCCICVAHPGLHSCFICYS